MNKDLVGKWFPKKVKQKGKKNVCDANFLGKKEGNYHRYRQFP